MALFRTFLVVVAGVLAATATALPDASLPKGFLGYWQGIPYATVLGPFAVPLNFSIMEVSGSEGNTFLIRDQFMTNSAHGSRQQFWLQSFVDWNGQVSSNLTYCGLLLNFLIVPGHLATVTVVLSQIARNETYMAFNLTEMPGWPTTGLWEMQLSDDLSQLTLSYEMPIGVNHLYVVMNRTHKGAFPIDFSGPLVPGSPAPCNLTQPYASEEEVYAGKAPASRCPLGFTHGVPPPHVQKIIDAKRAAKTAVVKTAAITPAVVAEKPKPASYRGYQYCYCINGPMNFTVRWNWNTSTETADVLFSAHRPDGGDISSKWIALGVLPNWPMMQGMDIVMGYFGKNDTTKGCVRSMYASDVPVGTPIDYDFNITDTAVWREDNTLFVKFTRPWNAGHHDISGATPLNTQPWVIPSVSFALGEAADTCDSRPHYHFGDRGTYGFWWPNPEGMMSHYNKCHQVDAVNSSPGSLSRRGEGEGCGGAIR